MVKESTKKLTERLKWLLWCWAGCYFWYRKTESQNNNVFFCFLFIIGCCYIIKSHAFRKEICFFFSNLVHFPYAHHGYLARLGGTGWLFQYCAKLVFPKKQDQDSYFMYQKTFWGEVPKVSHFQALEKKRNSRIASVRALAWQWLWMGSWGSDGALITVTAPTSTPPPSRRTRQNNTF